MVPAFVVAKFMTPLAAPPEDMGIHENFAAYREKARGTYSEIMSRHHRDPDLSFLDTEARKIFF